MELKHAYTIVSTEWRISVLLEDAWHLPEPRASQGNVEQAEVGCIPALCITLPHSIQKLHRAFTLRGLFGIIVCNSSVIV